MPNDERRARNAESLTRNPRPAPRSPKPPARGPNLETRIGKVKHYFGRVGVAIIVCESDGLALGETLHIKGNTTDLTFAVESLQVARQPIATVARGKDVAVSVPERVRPDDIVFKKKE